jgi:hypothetical protein
LTNNLLSEIIHIRERNIIIFKKVFEEVACDIWGNLKKAILHNSSKIQPEMLSQFVIEKFDQGDIFSFKKVEAVILNENTFEEEEDWLVIDFRPKVIIEDENSFKRAEKRRKLIQSCKCY